MVVCLSICASNIWSEDSELSQSDLSITADQLVSDKIDYSKLFADHMMFIGLRQGFRLTEEKTRDQLSGPFVEDWFDSVNFLFNKPRFDDGGKFFTNYIAHPMQGSGAANIFRLNDPISRKAKFGWNEGYFRAKKRQFGFAVVDTLLFEIGPISESSLGNIKQGWGDLVITPTLGIAWSVGEDALRHHVIDRVYVNHPNWGNVLAIFLNPTRSFTNMMTFRKPWSRD